MWYYFISGDTVDNIQPHFITENNSSAETFCESKLFHFFSHQFVYGVVCPGAVGLAAGALGAGSSGFGSMVVAAGANLGKNLCKIKKEKKCKREVSNSKILLALTVCLRFLV